MCTKPSRYRLRTTTSSQKARSFVVRPRLCRNCSQVLDLRALARAVESGKRNQQRRGVDDMAQDSPDRDLMRLSNARYGLAEVPFDSPYTTPPATPTAAIRPIFSSSERRCFCLSGAMASPAGRDARRRPSERLQRSLCLKAPASAAPASGCGAGVAGSGSRSSSPVCLGAGFCARLVLTWAPVAADPSKDRWWCRSAVLIARRRTQPCCCAWAHSGMPHRHQPSNQHHDLGKKLSDELSWQLSHHKNFLLLARLLRISYTSCDA